MAFSRQTFAQSIGKLSHQSIKFHSSRSKVLPIVMPLQEQCTTGTGCLNAHRRQKKKSKLFLYSLILANTVFPKSQIRKQGPELQLICCEEGKQLGKYQIKSLECFL